MNIVHPKVVEGFVPAPPAKGVDVAVVGIDIHGIATTFRRRHRRQHRASAAIERVVGRIGGRIERGRRLLGAMERWGRDACEARGRGSTETG